MIEDIEAVHDFSGLVASMENDEARWLTFLDHPNAENAVPEYWLQNNPDLSKDVNQVMKMIIMNAIRPDRFVNAAKQLIESVLSEESTNVG